jgi:hypothetical protein
MTYYVDYFKMDGSLDCFTGTFEECESYINSVMLDNYEGAAYTQLQNSTPQPLEDDQEFDYEQKINTPINMTYNEWSELQEQKQADYYQMMDEINAEESPF